MADAPALWLSLLGIAAGAGAPAGADTPVGGQADDELLALLEFLGDAETAGEDWSGFFDSLPDRPDDTDLPAPDPVPAEEAKP